MKRAEGACENFRKQKRPAFTPEDLSFDILEKELSGSLSIANFADPMKEVPGDLE